MYLQLSWKFDLKKDNRNQFQLEKTPIVFSYLKEIYLLNGNSEKHCLNSEMYSEKHCFKN